MFFRKKPPSSVEHIEVALLEAQKTIGTLLSRVLLLEHTMLKALTYSGELAKQLHNVQEHNEEIHKQVYSALESLHETDKVILADMYDLETQSEPLDPIK